MHSGEDRTAQVMYSEIPRKNGDQAAGDCQQSLALYPRRRGFSPKLSGLEPAARLLGGGGW